MIVAVIAGSRKRSSTRGVDDPKVKGDIQKDDMFLVNQLLSNLANRYKGDLRVLACACDDGIGLIVKNLCVERQIRVAEMVWYFHGVKWETTESSKMYLGRSPALLELGDVFAILIDEQRQGVAEDLLSRLRNVKDMEDGCDRPYVVLDERGRVIEEHKKGAIL